MKHKELVRIDMDMSPVEAAEWTAVAGGDCGGIFLGTEDGKYTICVTAWW